MILKLRRDSILPGKFSVAEIGAQQLGDGVLRDPSLLRAYAGARSAFPTVTSAAPCRRPGPRRSSCCARTPPSRRISGVARLPTLAADVDWRLMLIRLDLNFDDVPDEHKGKYQLVTSFGATEHVANQNQAMKIMRDLTAVGGVMVHGDADAGLLQPRHVQLQPEVLLVAVAKAASIAFSTCGSWDVVSTPISSDIANEVAKYDPVNAEQIRQQQAVDAGLIVVLQKIEDIPFVPPIDTSSAEIVADETARARYWTVFGGAETAGRSVRTSRKAKPRSLERLLRWRSRT